MNPNHRSNAARAIYSIPEPQPRPRELVDLLIVRAATGDRDAIAHLARTCHALLVASARRRGAGCDAEDVVQDLYVLLLERALVPPMSFEDPIEWLFDHVDGLSDRYR